MKVVHLNKDRKETPAEALAKVLSERWERKDRQKAEKKTQRPSQQQVLLKNK